MSGGFVRDDREVALNDADRACRVSAEGFADAAERVAEPALRGLFAELEGSRRDIAAELDRAIRSLGDLPQRPDPEASLVQQAVSRVKATLSPDERRSLIDERAEADRALLDCLEAALQQDLPPQLHHRIDAFRARIAEDLARLQDAAAAIGSRQR